MGLLGNSPKNTSILQAYVADSLDMSPIQGAQRSAAVTTPSTSPTKARMEVSVMKMEQDQAKADGDAAVRLMNTAAEVQATGKGGRVDVRA